MNEVQSILRAFSAIHEAGHAVVSLACGREVVEIGVMQDSGASGTCSCQCEVAGGDDVLTVNAAIIMAGNAAEDLYGSEYRDYLGMEAAATQQAVQDLPTPTRTAPLVGDQLVLVQMLTKATGTTPDTRTAARWAQVGYRVAYDHLRQRAAAVSHVAKELETRGRLTGDELSRVLASAPMEQIAAA